MRECRTESSRNSEGVATGSGNVDSSVVSALIGRNSFRVATRQRGLQEPRVAKAQPWAKISQRFQRFKIGVAWILKFQLRRGQAERALNRLPLPYLQIRQQELLHSGLNELIRTPSLSLSLSLSLFLLICVICGIGGFFTRR